MGNNFYSNLVFLPPDPTTYTSRVPRKCVFLPTSTGKKIPAYYIPSKKKDVRTCIIYSHGNAADIGAMDEFLTLLHNNLPVHILHYEYLGYGLAKQYGPPSESKVYESVEAGLNYLINDRGFDFEDIIAYGHSVGSGPTVHLVNKYKRMKGLILESAFSSALRVVANWNVTKVAKGFDTFCNLSKIGSVRSPVLVYHGRNDSVVPFNHSEDLWGKVQKEYRFKNVWVKEADHHDIIEVMGPKNYLSVLMEFLKYADEMMKKRKSSGEIEKIKKAEREKKGYIKKKKKEFEPVREGENEENDNFQGDDYYDIYKLV